MQLTAKQTGSVGTVQDSSWTAVDVGWTDAELTETSARVALDPCTNHFNHLVQTDLDLRPAPQL